MKRITFLTVFVLILSLFTVHAAANQDVPYHFGFKKSKGGQLPSIDQEGFKGIVDKHEAIFLGDTSKKSCFLRLTMAMKTGSPLVFWIS